MFSRALALEFSKQQVRIYAVCPGAVNTPLAQDIDLPEGIEMALPIDGGATAG